MFGDIKKEEYIGLKEDEYEGEINKEDVVMK